MTKRNKSIFCVVGIACLLTAIIFTNIAMKKRSVILSLARARYAVNIVNGTESQTNQIPQILALELANKIEEGSSIMVFDEKSVDFGTIHLLDSNMETIAHIWVLKYPLFQFIGVKQKFRAQLKLKHDLAGALGFTLQGYNPSAQGQNRKGREQ